MKKTFLLVSTAGGFLLSGCVSDFERNIAYKIVTALPQEVQGCAMLTLLRAQQSIMPVLT